MYLCPTQTGLAAPAAGPALAGGGVLRAGVAVVPAAGLCPGVGNLTAGLAGRLVACPPEKALRDLRRHQGPAPLTALFEVVAGPLAWPHTPGGALGRDAHARPRWPQFAEGPGTE